MGFISTKWRANLWPGELKQAKPRWFISSFQRTLKWPVLGLPKSYSIFNKTVSFLVEFCVLGVGHSCRLVAGRPP